MNLNIYDEYLLSMNLSSRNSQLTAVLLAEAGVCVLVGLAEHLHGRPDHAGQAVHRLLVVLLPQRPLLLPLLVLGPGPAAAEYREHDVVIPQAAARGQNALARES